MKEVYTGKQSDLVHRQFKRFSKGVFENRALLDIRKTGNNIKIKSSFEYAEGLIRFMASKLGSDKANMTGCIISTKKLNEEPIFSDFLANAEVKQFQGVKRFIIKEDLTGDKLIEMMDKYPNALWSLSFNVGDYALKIKDKAPKAGKTSKGDEEPKADFCVLTCKDEKVLKDFLDETDFKKVFIKHTFVIDNIKVPKEYENDFAKARENALKCGKVIRYVTVDSKESKKEFKLEG